MKEESSVIVNYKVMVNFSPNFAHTAHHARKKYLIGKYYGL